MRKAYLTTVFALGFALISSTVFAQSAADKDNQQATKETSTNTQVSDEAAEQAKLLKHIEAFEAKIEANKDNPNIDLSAAREELRQLKVQAGLIEEKE